MSYDSSNLTTPDIKARPSGIPCCVAQCRPEPKRVNNFTLECTQWLGVRPSDLDRFNIPQQCRLPMTDEDVRTGKRLVCCMQRHHSLHMLLCLVVC